MPSTPRIILITGATGGLGRELAREYASEPGHLILHGRNNDKLRLLEVELSKSSADITTIQADFSELSEVERFAGDVAKLTESISVLVNNAGIGQGQGDEREESADDFELRLAVNHLAPFALTLRLLPQLRAGAPARVVNVASAAQEPIDFDDPQLARGYSGSRAYAQSKFAMVATGFHLAKQLPAEEITVNSLHPATLMPTTMVTEGWGHTVDELSTGVAATRNLIESPDLTGVSGRYYFKQEEGEALPESYDEQLQQRLWQLSEEWTGVSLSGQ